MSSEVTPVLSVGEVTKSFGAKVAVNQLSLEVQKGEIFGFLGPNGAGKTTTIRIILDVLRPNQGNVRIFGQNNRLTTTIHRRLGYLSGDMVIDSDLTGGQYLNFVNSLYGGQNQSRVEELAKLLHINLRTKIANYSHGNKQKIALIAALMHQPELLILDEPTTGFDPLVQATFSQLIKKYQAQGGTVFMSSHILSEVQRLCDRVAFIKDGSLIGIKTIEELKKNSTKTIKIISPVSEISAIKTKYKNLPGLKLQASSKTSISFTYIGNMRPLMRFLSGYDVDDITIAEPELEEVFISYYKDKN